MGVTYCYDGKFFKVSVCGLLNSPSQQLLVATCICVLE